LLCKRKGLFGLWRFQSMTSYPHCFGRSVWRKKLSPLGWEQKEEEIRVSLTRLQEHTHFLNLSLVFKVPPPPTSATSWNQAFNTWTFGWHFRPKLYQVCRTHKWPSCFDVDASSQHLFMYMLISASHKKSEIQNTSAPE
jgi:hypothetical protein